MCTGFRESLLRLVLPQSRVRCARRGKHRKEGEGSDKGLVWWKNEIGAVQGEESVEGTCRKMKRGDKKQDVKKDSSTEMTVSKI